MPNKAVLLSEADKLLLKKHNIKEMPEVKVQRLSATKSARLSAEMAQVTVVDKPVQKRSKSKDAVKVAKASSKKKTSLSPQKSKSPSRVSRAKSKSPARSPSRSRKDPKKTHRTASPTEKPTRGAKLYTKKDLVQEPTPTEVSQRRVLRSSSSMSSKSDLKSVMKVELVKSNESINESAAKLNESTKKEVCTTNCDEVLFDLGYLKFTRRHVMHIIFFTFVLMLVLTMVNHYDNNREVYQAKLHFYINSLKNGCDFTKNSLKKFKSKFFKS
jgi:hypothetical protein